MTDLNMFRRPTENDDDPSGPSLFSLLMIGVVAGLTLKGLESMGSRTIIIERPA